MATEDKFPTIRDLRDAFADLVSQGLGDHPVQVVIVPGSTMRAIERTVRNPVNMDSKIDDRPPLMIELPLEGAGRLAVTLVSVDWLSGRQVSGAIQ